MAERASWLALMLLAASAPTLVRADAIMPFDGECPPGLESAIRNHEEVCSPMACDGTCPEGARCASLFECWARRPMPVSRFSEETRDIDVVVAPCDADRHCTEGACRERRQCEPIEETPAWDRSARRWTAVSHPPAPAGCGCRADGAASGPSAWLVSLAAIAVAVRRRGR